MNPFAFFWYSSIGKKWLVALTGLVLIAYVIGHLVGNLQVFLAPGQINGYAALLHTSMKLLWAVRLALIVCFVLHIVTTIRLVLENRAARPERYARSNHVQATWASRTMAYSGVIVLAFIVFHLLHFTTRSVDSTFRPLADGGVLATEYDVHTMVIRGFAGHPLITAFYLLGLFLLCLHLSHGFSSLLQTLGLNSRRAMAPLTHAGRALAWLIFAGYALIPVAIWLHLLKTAHP